MDAQNIGKTIQRLRLSGGLTQKQLADKLSVTDKAVSKWENGYGLPDITIMPEIAAVFGISIDELYSASAPKKKEESVDIEEEKPAGGRLHLTQITLNQFSLTQVITFLAVIVLMLFNSSVSVNASGETGSLSFISIFGDTLMGLSVNTNYPSSVLAYIVFAFCPIFVVAVIVFCVYLIIKTLFPDTKNSIAPNVVFAGVVTGALLLSLLFSFILNKQYGNNVFFIPVTYYAVCGLSLLQLIMEYSVHNYTAAFGKKSRFTFIMILVAIVTIGGSALTHRFSYSITPEFYTTRNGLSGYYESEQTVNLVVTPRASENETQQRAHLTIGFITIEGNISPFEIMVGSIILDGRQITSGFSEHNGTVAAQVFRYRTADGYAALVKLNNLDIEQVPTADSIITVQMTVAKRLEYVATLNIGEINEYQGIDITPFERQLDIKHKIKYQWS